MHRSIRLESLLVALILFVSYVVSCCKDNKIVSVYKYFPPTYDSVGFSVSKDTISFLLADNFYNQVKAFNYFVDAGVGYLSLYDRGSQSIGIFNFESRSIVSRIYLNRFIRKREFYKTAVFVKSLDTIIVANRDRLIIIDTGKLLKYSCRIENGQLMELGNTSQPLIAGKRIVVPSKLKASSRDLISVKSWRLLFEMKQDSKIASRKYQFPAYYTQRYYGKHLMQYYICVNSSGKLVFSLAADSLLYETDLEGDQYSYFARSRFQVEDIRPMSRSAIVNDLESDEYLLRDSYGPVYFDLSNRRYVRIASSAISAEDLQKGNRRRNYSLIILNGDFRVIGEQVIGDSLNVYNMFFDRHGHLYVRVDASNEYAVRFVKLTYREMFDNDSLKKKD